MTIKARSKKGVLELRRRVPRKYASVEPREFIWASLETDSPAVAAHAPSQRGRGRLHVTEARFARKAAALRLRDEPESRREGKINGS